MHQLETSHSQQTEVEPVTGSCCPHFPDDDTRSLLSPVASIEKFVWEADYNAAGEVEGSDYVRRRSPLSCRNPHSQAYVNCYVKWPFILYSLLRMEVLVWALCGNDIVKRKGRHVCKYVVTVLVLSVLYSSSSHNTLARTHTIISSLVPPLAVYFYRTKESHPSSSADKCRADAPSYFLNMFV